MQLVKSLKAMVGSLELNREEKMIIKVRNKIVKYCSRQVFFILHP